MAETKEERSDSAEEEEMTLFGRRWPAGRTRFPRTTHKENLYKFTASQRQRRGPYNIRTNCRARDICIRREEITTITTHKARAMGIGRGKSPLLRAQSRLQLSLESILPTWSTPNVEHFVADWTESLFTLYSTDNNVVKTSLC